MKTYAIKCKEVTGKSWSFLTPSGGLNRLKIHAGRFASKEVAEKVIAENAGDNPEWQFKAVPL